MDACFQLTPHIPSPSSLFLSLDSFFSTQCCALHDKVSIARFHQPDSVKDMTSFMLLRRHRRCCCFSYFSSLLSPMYSLQFVTPYKQIKKCINKSKFSCSYLPFRSVPFGSVSMVHYSFSMLSPKRRNLSSSPGKQK